MHICVVGLGYVGLPLTLHLAKSFNVIGFDNNERRVKTLLNGEDYNNEYSREEILETSARFTSDEGVLRFADFIIVTVPTPITDGNKPDLSPLEEASCLIGNQLNRSRIPKSDAIRMRPIIVFESTVYPGVTEEFCVPIIESCSALKCGKDFFVGYSPERVNPGDQVNTIDKITKVVSGMDLETLDIVDKVYSSFTKTHRASSIKVAEAAKVIENSQRDLNIAFVNELALIFDKLGIDTNDVLEAAGTKWNFLPFKPGLVGGHCISVDPYYLTYKAEDAGVISQVILAGRHINDKMPNHVVSLVTKGLNKHKKSVNGANILILGATFKEDCKDVRNSKVEDIVIELEEMGAYVTIYDPFYERETIPFHKRKKVGLSEVLFIDYLRDLGAHKPYDMVVLAVAHKEIKESFTIDKIRGWMDKPVIVDLKNVLGKHEDVIRL